MSKNNGTNKGDFMEYLGEKSFTRSDPDVYINYVECIKNNKTWKDQKKCFWNKGVYTEVRTEEKLGCETSYFKRLRLIKGEKNNFKTTKLGDELLKSAKKIDRDENKNWNFKIMKKIDYIFMKSIILLSHYAKNKEKNKRSWQKFSLFKSILKTIINNKKGLGWKEINKKSQPIEKIEKLKNWIEDQDFTNNKNDFITVMTEQPKKKSVGKAQNQNKKSKVFWSKYFDLIQLNIKTFHSKEKNNWKKIIEEFKDDSTFKKQSKKLWTQKLFCFPQNLTNKKNDLTWVNRLTSEDFLKLWNQENLTKIIANYRYFYSEKDYEGITLQNIRLGFKFLHYESSSKKGEKTNISIKEGYLTFASQLVKHWDELAFKLDKNPDLKFEDFLQIIKFKDKNIKKMDFKDMLSSKFSIALIDKFLDLFANYKNKSAAIEKELEGCNLNTKIKLPTWFEWFVGLKLIYLSNHHLDESIFNLKLDSNYEPHSTHAAGGRADMQGKIWEKDFIVEVTLLYGRAISKSENESVRNHLAKSKPRPNFALFISPEKSYDFNYIVKMGYYDLEGKFYKNEDIEIKCLTIQEFLQFRNLKDLIDH